MPESNGLVQTNPMNNTHGKHTHNYSSFPDSLSYKHYMTLRFGDCTPSFVMNGEPKDEISLSARHIIDSLSLNAPFKGSVRKITESFMVPNMAILPMNWDRIYAQPANGDDVPKDANCVLQLFPERFSAYWSSLYDLVYDNLPAKEATGSSMYTWLTALLRMLVIGEYIYSAGSLASVCGYHGNAQFRINTGQVYHSFDWWFDSVINYVFKYIDTISVNEPVGDSNRVHYFKGLHADSSSNYVGRYESFRALLELFRENPTCYIVSFTNGFDGDFGEYLSGLASTPDALYPLFPELGSGYGDIQFILPLSTDPVVDELTDMSQQNFNLSRILAYQIVCAHYYSNSAVDFVYSAELYRQYVKSLYDLFASITGYPSIVSNPAFEWNGMNCPYDFLSEKVLIYLLCLSDSSLFPTYVQFTSNSNNLYLASFAAYAAIFGFRKSLRFGDYFVGSRPRPLAPVNTDVSVNNNLVSVIDVTRSIQAQRFANSVMRSRAKIENYVRDLFGKSPSPDYHNPFYLTRQAEMIYGDEVQNTAESQVSNSNSRTSNFKSGDARFTFTFHNDDAHPCIYLQIVTFDIKRAYTRSIDRHFMHLDRFDMFNPDFQYIGDQPVYGFELGYPDVDDEHMPAVFAYQGRDMEYKQRFDVASGGFVENLPGWCLTDDDRSIFASGHLDPDFIRSYNTEFDQFFISLNGFSLASYFHFVMIANNHVSAKRAMAVDPQILE